MTSELVEALAVVLKTCLDQDSCRRCPMANICGKMPCAWDEGEDAE